MTERLNWTELKSSLKTSLRSIACFHPWNSPGLPRVQSGSHVSSSLESRVWTKWLCPFHHGILIISSKSGGAFLFFTMLPILIVLFFFNFKAWWSLVGVSCGRPISVTEGKVRIRGTRYWCAHVTACVALRESSPRVRWVSDGASTAELFALEYL